MRQSVSEGFSNARECGGRAPDVRASDTGPRRALPHVHLEIVPCDYCDRRAVIRTPAGAVCSRHGFGPGRVERNEAEAHRLAKKRMVRA